MLLSSFPSLYTLCIAFLSVFVIEPPSVPKSSSRIKSGSNRYSIGGGGGGRTGTETIASWPDEKGEDPACPADAERDACNSDVDGLIFALRPDHAGSRLRSADRTHCRRRYAKKKDKHKPRGGGKGAFIRLLLSRFSRMVRRQWIPSRVYYFISSRPATHTRTSMRRRGFTPPLSVHIQVTLRKLAVETTLLLCSRRCRSNSRSARQIDLTKGHSSHHHTLIRVGFHSCQTFHKRQAEV